MVSPDARRPTPDARRPTPDNRVLAFLFALFALMPVGPRAEEHPRPRGHVTRYDVATREDLLFANMVSPLMRGEAATWEILKGFSSQVGDWVDDYTNAQKIANVITETFPIDGQPLKKLDDLAAECAAILGLDKPAVYVRNDPITRAYVVQAYNQNHLVLTSGLLKLYQDRSDELKFIIGRELGHVLCGHGDLKNKAYSTLAVIQTINVAAIAPKYVRVLPTLALGRLFTWCRDSEFSADRAGLLCCGEPKVAYQAIMRLLHGLDPESVEIWIDPDAKEFNADAVTKNFQQWQYRPFVEFITDLKRQKLDSPYVPDRLAMLKGWADTGEYREILRREATLDEGQLIEVVRIEAYGLAPEGQTVDPYVIVKDDEDKRILRTVVLSGLREAEWHGFKNTDKGVDQPRPFRNGQPLFFEIWDSNYGFGLGFRDTLVGGFTVYPRSRDAEARQDGDREATYKVKIQWDWKEPSNASRLGYAQVTVRFLSR